jgi:membrane-associated phospholipid phosphatase
MISVDRGQKVLYITYFILLLTTVAILSLIAKGDAVLFLNKWHSSGLDSVMVFITKLGELWGFALVFIALAFHASWRQMLAFVLTCILMLAIIFCLKHYVFPEFLRPSIVLEKEHLHFIEGLYVNKKFSFPSGHTTAAFTFYLYLALGLKRGIVKVTLLFVAVLIGFSRIYLAQHFLQDVVLGSVIGMLLASLGYFVLSEKWLKSYRVLDGQPKQILGSTK